MVKDNVVKDYNSLALVARQVVSHERGLSMFCGAALLGAYKHKWATGVHASSKRLVVNLVKHTGEPIGLDNQELQGLSRSGSHFGQIKVGSKSSYGRIKSSKLRTSGRSFRGNFCARSELVRAGNTWKAFLID